MKIKSTQKLTATITIGQNIGYSDKTFSKEELYKVLQSYQDERIKDANIYLSAFVSSGDIVLSKQVEKHFIIEFINYPKFPLDSKTFKKEIIKLTNHLMKAFNQNRVVIIFSDEIIMIEEDDMIDPRIKSS